MWAVHWYLADRRDPRPLWTLVKAWAPMKSFRPKAGDMPPDNDPGSPPVSDASAKGHPEQSQTETDPMPRQTRNAEVVSRGEKPSNATNASRTDPDARL